MRIAVVACLLACLTLSAGVARASLDGRALFGDKCLYCHSATPIQKQRLTAVEWHKVVERMRGRAPLLISASQANVIVQYLVSGLRLVPRVAPKPAPRRRVDRPDPPPTGVTPAPVDTIAPAEVPATEPLVAEAPGDPEAEAMGPLLLQSRCSKCHSTYRVYTKIDKLSVGLATIERMRHKTGANITPEDAEMLGRFLRTRIDSQP